MEKKNRGQHQEVAERSWSGRSVKKKKLKNVKDKKRLEQVYGLGKKGILYEQEFLKGKIHAGACKVQNYLKRNLQFR